MNGLGEVVDGSGTIDPANLSNSGMSEFSCLVVIVSVAWSSVRRFFDVPCACAICVFAGCPGCTGRLVAQLGAMRLLASGCYRRSASLLPSFAYSVTSQVTFL